MTKKILISIGLIVVAFTSHSQDISRWSKDTLALANTAANVAGLSDEEKKVIQVINLARLNGKSFIKRIAEPWAEKNEEADDYYLETMYSDLRIVSGMHLLKHHEKLHAAASFHAHDMGITGGIGHDSSNGTKLFDRIHRYHKSAVMSESCSYGYNNAIDIVMELLLNEGVTELGDRKNILGKDFHHIGVSIKPHKGFDFNGVLVFASF